VKAIVYPCVSNDEQAESDVGLDAQFEARRQIAARERTRVQQNAGVSATVDLHLRHSRNRVASWEQPKREQPREGRGRS
jgi:hypothetical protein